MSAAELAAAAPLVFSPAALAVLGLLVGSFLNVVILRLPLILERGWKEESADLLGVAPPAHEGPPLGIVKPRSRCPSCGHAIAWYENIPIVSWLVLRGRCSACKTRISARYPIVEAATGVLFGLVAWKVGAVPQALLWCGFVGALVALSGIDWDTTLLPDGITMPLLWAGVIAALLGWTIPLADAIRGALAGYLSLWSVYWVFKLTTGKEGMGYGDFKLLAALGAWLGWKMILPIVLGASLIGAVVGIVMKMSKTLREGNAVPFGPFLAGAGIAVLLLGEPRVLGYLGW